MGRVQGLGVLSDVDDVDAVDDNTDDDSGAGDVNEVAAPTARDVCEYLVKAVVEEADDVEVDVAERGRGTTIEVRVASGDMGRVIGKRGRVAQSIRTIVRAAAVRDGASVDVDFIE